MELVTSPFKRLFAFILWLEGHRANLLRQTFEREALFVFAMGTAAFFWLALISFSPTDPSPYSAAFPYEAIHNWGGKLGASISSYVLFWFGIIAFLIPLPPLYSAALLMSRAQTPISKGRFV